MAMNRVQFQKGLSLHDFMAQFGTEQAGLRGPSHRAALASGLRLRALWQHSSLGEFQWASHLGVP